MVGPIDEVIHRRLCSLTAGGLSAAALGGSQGGVEMKRALLEMKGVEVSAAGKVLTDRVHY